jgi:RimJ/RimL family protein N-acetyltransferase
LTKGVGFYVVCGNEAVSRCAATCRAGDQIEVSIITDPEHRKRGLATLAVAATVEYCLGHGFNTVGWYSDLDNFGSWKTAEKVGFEKAGEYFYYYYMLDAIDHLAELGWFYFRRREYERAAQYYERAFASRENHPHYYYHIAAAAWAMQGKRKRAFKYLHAAADHGWAWPESTKQSKALHSLHGDPEWEVVLARMKENVP